jgi:hypothetical protein
MLPDVLIFAKYLNIRHYRTTPTEVYSKYSYKKTCMSHPLVISRRLTILLAQFHFTFTVTLIVILQGYF